ncbi:hypothetical protein QBC46DRAFT_418612 [Diplogelasinospora grovesii]|uniref:Uncharacterized protein n=1 Tax=Diplogelasinospora grovesii TaxID=303347 RepID=A0AAN6MZW1_9PEZI|nr:hypothetical protein QBC46DRAFT_418612 [Diplogelasinospora grovesii]
MAIGDLNGNDCGDDLYADFPDVDDGGALDRLLSSLQNPAPQPDGGTSSIALHSMSSSVSSDSSAGTTGLNSLAESTHSPCGSATSEVTTGSSLTSISRGAGSRPKFLALCVNTGGIYKTLAEIEASDTDTDLTAFRKMKEGYLKTRGVRARFSYLVRPIGVEFVHFNLWSRRRGYLSVCDRPNSIPPLDSGEYEYAPKPLKPLVPMPPRVIDCGDDQSPGPCFGWGIHVIEGPNRSVIAGMVVLAVLVGIVTSAIWSAVRGDVQGGFAIGAMIVAVPSVALTAVVFRLEGV